MPSSIETIGNLVGEVGEAIDELRRGQMQAFAFDRWYLPSCRTRKLAQSRRNQHILAGRVAAFSMACMITLDGFGVAAEVGRSRPRRRRRSKPFLWSSFFSAWKISAPQRRLRGTTLRRPA